MAAISFLGTSAVTEGDFELFELLIFEVAPVKAVELGLSDVLDIGIMRKSFDYVYKTFALAHAGNVLEVLRLRCGAVGAAMEDVEDKVPFLMEKALVGAIIAEGLAVEEMAGLGVRLLDTVMQANLSPEPPVTELFRLEPGFRAFWFGGLQLSFGEVNIGYGRFKKWR